MNWFPFSVLVSPMKRTPFAPVGTACNSIRMCFASTRSTLPHYFEVHFRSAMNMNASPCRNWYKWTCATRTRKIKLLNRILDDPAVIGIAIDHVGCRDSLVPASQKVLPNLSLLRMLPSSVAAKSLKSTPFTKNNAKSALISLSLTLPLLIVCQRRSRILCLPN